MGKRPTYSGGPSRIFGEERKVFSIIKNWVMTSRSLDTDFGRQTSNRGKKWVSEKKNDKAVCNTLALKTHAIATFAIKGFSILGYGNKYFAFQINTRSKHKAKIFGCFVPKPFIFVILFRKSFYQYKPTIWKYYNNFPLVTLSFLSIAQLC